MEWDWLVIEHELAEDMAVMAELRVMSRLDPLSGALPPSLE